MSEQPKGLSREYIIKAVLQVLDDVPLERKWGSVEISFQNGVFKTIKEVETTTEEK
jgi:hypothetical protein